ncbi:receptor-type tyrosine-protein phosphatase V-like isoform X1 [Macaca nemestrina]|uniref:receptor-type tyrosine-protein phosphatase V-like isoform X1 n=1 Tax=Macaca nemestrina TaxID=9545 RepID=UPI0039B995E5
MRPPILFAALLWLRGFLAEEEACPSLERSAGRESAAPPTVHGLQLHSPGSPSSLEASWGEAPEEQDGYRLLLYHLESQTLAHNISMPPGTLCYNFGDLLPGTLRPPSELLVSSHASTTVVSLAWVSGPLGVHSLGTRRGSQLSEVRHLSWEHPLVPGQAHLILRGLIPGCNLSLSVLCQVGPLQASTHRVVLLVDGCCTHSALGYAPHASPGGQSCPKEMFFRLAETPFRGHKCPVPLCLQISRALHPEALLMGSALTPTQHRAF